jgi:hypothetical protein
MTVKVWQETLGFPQMGMANKEGAILAPMPIAEHQEGGNLDA